MSILQDGKSDGMSRILSKIREFITTNFYLAKSALADGDSLVDRGIIDSTGVLEVVDFLESEFGIAVPMEEMLPENFDSVESIAAFVGRKTNAELRASP